MYTEHVAGLQLKERCDTGSHKALLLIDDVIGAKHFTYQSC
jgi:hypothetical protein